MKLRKAIKKMVALGTGVTMVGATLLGAAAQDLAEFPAPFVMNGVFDGVLVVGDDASAADTLGLGDVISSLQYASTTTTTVSTGATTTVSVTGDAEKITESTNQLEIKELTNNVKSGITETDMNALAGGTITNDFGTFDYEQDIEIPASMSVIFAIDPDDDTDTPAPYLWLNASAAASNAYTYKVTFSPALKSDYSTAAADDLEDIEDKKITILGKEYTIIDTDMAASGDIVLKLMGGAIDTTMTEYETKTFTINGVEYKVEVLIVDDNAGTTKLKINGEVTDELSDGETYKLNDGTEAGIKSILANEGTEVGGGDLVEFYLGASKITLDDGNTNNTAYDGTLQVADETIDNVKIDIRTSAPGGLAHGTDVTIASIQVRYNASQDLYTPAGGSVAAVADEIEDELGNFFLDGFDIEFEGLEVGTTEEITLKPSGSDNYKLKFTNKNGDICNQEVFGRNGSAIFLGKGGSNPKDIETNESQIISDEEFFTVNKNKYSHILRLKDINTGDAVIKLKDECNGNNLEVSYSSNTGTLNLDGNSYRINVSGTNSIFADMDASNSIQTGHRGGVLYTQYGANITLYGTEGGGAYNYTGTLAENQLTFRSEDRENSQAGETTRVQVYVTSSNELDLNTTSPNLKPGGWFTLLQVGDGDLYQGYDLYGTFFERDRKSSTTTDQDDYRIVYPDEQVTAAVFYTSGVTAATTSGTSGEVETTVVNPIPVGAAKFASEVADVTAVNAIVIGGPCANAAAAVLTGVAQSIPECLAGLSLEEGNAVLKMYEHTTGKVALLVAGATGTDTRRAARALSNYEAYALSGSEVVVYGTTLTDINVKAPAAE